MTATKNQNRAKAFVSLGLVAKTETGYRVSTPAFRGVSTYYDVTGGKCECIFFEESGDCEHVQAAELFAAPDEAQLKAVEILSSARVASVEVGLDETHGDVRIYSAVSKDNGIPHIYRVRVSDDFSTGERVTTGKCNCLAGAKSIPCRHVLAVAKKDSDFMRREIYPNEIAKYRAHRLAA